MNEQNIRILLRYKMTIIITQNTKYQIQKVSFYVYMYVHTNAGFFSPPLVGESTIARNTLPTPSLPVASKCVSTSSMTIRLHLNAPFLRITSANAKSRDMLTLRHCPPDSEERQRSTYVPSADRMFTLLTIFSISCPCIT